MLAYAGDRPLSLVRCPQGREKQCFFQKHPSDGFPEELARVPIKEKDGGSEDYLYATDAAGLVAAPAQLRQQASEPPVVVVLALGGDVGGRAHAPESTSGIRRGDHDASSSAPPMRSSIADAISPGRLAATCW